MKALIAAFVVLASVSLGAQRFVPGKYLSPTFASATEVTIIGNTVMLWSIRGRDVEGNPIVMQFFWGANGDVVLPAADYDGDGIDDPAVYRPQTKAWWILKSSCRWTCYDNFILNDVSSAQCPEGTHPQLGPAENVACVVDQGW